MYQIATPAGMGATATPIVNHPKWQRLRKVHPVAAHVIRKWHQRRAGMGCACGVSGCACSNGLGQLAPDASASLTSLPGDFGTVWRDLFLNADGSINIPALGFAGLGVLLIYRNWGSTTRGGGRGKRY